MSELFVLVLATPLLLAAIVQLFLFECGPEDYVDVPASDPTPPTVAMDVPVPGRPTLNVKDGGAPASGGIGAGQVATAIAVGTDNDGGVRTVQIWATYTHWTANTQTGPGLAGAPEAENASTATQGERTLKQRIVSHNFDMTQIPAGATRARIVIWAVATNFHGGQATTPEVTLDWP